MNPDTPQPHHPTPSPFPPQPEEPYQTVPQPAGPPEPQPYQPQQAEPQPQPGFQPQPQPEFQPQPQPAAPQPAPYQPYTPQSYSQQATTPIEPVQAPAASHVPAGQLVLQWLTYAFWGWTLLGLSWLITIVVGTFMNQFTAGSTGITYIIAAVLVLLPISFTCDVFYSRKEQSKKTGPSMAIMVIHAVIFALIAIGTLITAVFCIVNKFTSSESAGINVALISSLIIFVFYAITFVRTLNPISLGYVRKFYRLIMLVSIGIVIILGIVGPIAKERASRNDRLVVSNIYKVTDAISDYTRDKKKLPTSLGDISVTGDAKTLVSKNLLEYKPEGKAPSKYDDSYSTDLLNYRSSYQTYRYQLCVDFKEKGEGSDYTSAYKDTYNDGYNTSASAYGHPKGHVCYKLETSQF